MIRMTEWLIRWLTRESATMCVRWAQLFLMPVASVLAFGGLVVFFAGAIIGNILIALGGVLLMIIGSLLGVAMDIDM